MESLQQGSTAYASGLLRVCGSLGDRVSGGWGMEEVVAQGVADSLGAVEVGEPEEDDSHA